MILFHFHVHREGECERIDLDCGYGYGGIRGCGNYGDWHYKKKIQDYNENFTFEDYPGGWEPSAYAANMDLDGVEACLLFASPTRYEYSSKDPKFQRCVFNASFRSHL